MCDAQIWETCRDGFDSCVTLRLFSYGNHEAALTMSTVLDRSLRGFDPAEPVPVCSVEFPDDDGCGEFGAVYVTGNVVLMCVGADPESVLRQCLYTKGKVDEFV